MTNHDPNRIIIFDTTLRDGEQALPQSLSARQKMQIALAFVGRQGRQSRTHLMSPAMAAAAAVVGHIVDVREMI